MNVTLLKETFEKVCKVITNFFFPPETCNFTKRTFEKVCKVTTKFFFPLETSTPQEKEEEKRHWKS